MLSIGRLAPGAENYYLRAVAKGREEYYTGSGEAPGVWVGRGTARLGLAGSVSSGDLSMVLAGLSPQGELLSTRRGDPARRVPGLDLTFSAPKSVSLLYALGDEQTARTVRDLHADAVNDALGYLERRALRVRRGAGGAERLCAEGFVAAAFLHRTSRSGDPQLHTHVLVANVAFGDDGTWSAPYARLVYHHARTAGFFYQASLRARLTDALGVRFGEVKNGMAEVEGLESPVLRAFSSRRQEIEAHLEAAGAHSPRAAQVAALATRSPKLALAAGATTHEGLRARWRARAAELGVTDATLVRLMGRHVRAPLTDDLRRRLVDRLVGESGLTAAESAFERRDVVRAVAELLRDGATGTEMEAIADLVLAGPGVVGLPSSGRGGERRHTTEGLLAVERDAVEHAVRRRNARAGVVPQPLVEAALSGAAHLAGEQQAMVRRLTTLGAGVDVVVGKAGSGKTAALGAARTAWEAAGLSVVGTALSARAAKGLADGAGIESVTIARLLGRVEKLTGALGDVLVVDEAGMVGTRTMARLLSAAERSGAKVVLVGDHRQLPEIDAGGTFGALVRRLGAAELHENRRQEEAWERRALDELRDGEVRSGLGALVAADRIMTAPDMAAARRRLVERWHGAVAAGEDALMLAVTRRDVGALNDAARRFLQESGVLGRDLGTFGDRSVAMGEVVVCLRNDAGIGVLNGTRGVVEAADRRGLLVSTQEGPRWLPAEYASVHLDYGYALSVHNAQGATVDRAFVLASESLTREAGYVAMSRARKGTELFVAASPIDDGLDCEEHGPKDLHALERVAARLSVSRAKHLALDEVEPAPDHLSGDKGATMEHRRRLAGTEEASGPASSSRDALDLAAVPIRRSKVPEYQLRAIGDPPTDAAGRAAYDRVARVVADYRRRYHVEATAPLGTPPLEATQRARYEEAARELRTYGRRLGRTRDLFGVDLGI